MATGHSDLRQKIQMAKDCLDRAEDGVESGSWAYVLDQIGKATVNVSESYFLADTEKLLAERDNKMKERLNDFARRISR